MMRPLLPLWLVALLPLVVAKKKSGGTAKVSHWQNCASRKQKQCHIPYHLRDLPDEAPPGSPKGHLKPIGHEDFSDTFLGNVEEFDSLDQEKFWNHHLYNGVPFILKGWGKHSKAVTENYTVKYLQDHFGGLTVKTEALNEDRLSDYCGAVKNKKKVYCPEDLIPYTEKRASLFTYLNRSVHEPNYDKYAISELPLPMAADFVGPTFHQCGTKLKPQGDRREKRPWETPGYENNIFFSMIPPGAHTTSVVHFDMNHQIMCTFSGVKEWILWDMSTEKTNIPMWSGYYKANKHLKYESGGSDDSPIDGERVDLLRWPEFAKAKWKRAMIQPGDCIWLPAMTAHYVRTVGDERPDFKGMSLSMMSLFQTLERYDPEVCKDADIKPFPLSEQETLWTFPGEDPGLAEWGHIKMGYSDWKRDHMYPFAEAARKKGTVTKKLFESFFSKRMKQRKVPNSQNRLGQAWSDFEKEQDPSPAHVYRSRAIRFLIKDIAAWEDGEHAVPAADLRPGQEWTARMDYTLSGDRATAFGERHEL